DPDRLEARHPARPPGLPADRAPPRPLCPPPPAPRHRARHPRRGHRGPRPPDGRLAHPRPAPSPRARPRRLPPAAGPGWDPTGALIAPPGAPGPRFGFARGHTSGYPMRRRSRAGPRPGKEPSSDARLDGHVIPDPGRIRWYGDAADQDLAGPAGPRRG